MSATVSFEQLRTGDATEKVSAVYQIRPLHDSRWSEFLHRHPRASVFHSPEWLESLQRTYGFEPCAYTTSPPGVGLQNSLVFCRVESWLTGRRLVSLPFSDHCDPLVTNREDLQRIIFALDEELHREKLLYIEVRPKLPLGQMIPCQSRYVHCSHHIDLSAELGTLFENFHKDSTQRKIRRAERECLTYEDGRSPALFDRFWHLYLLTRRRHKAPPQPKQWFHNLISCFGPALKIRITCKDGHPIAAILTIQYKDTLVYKYGCSDVRYNSLGGTHLLFWKCIQEAKRESVRVFDLGRS